MGLGGRKRDDAPHPSRRKDDRLAEAHPPLILLEESAEARRQNPDRAHGNEREADDDTDSRELEDRRAVELAGDARDLETDREEHDPVEEKDQALPDRSASEPRFGAHDDRRSAPEVQTGRHGGEHTGDAE